MTTKTYVLLDSLDATAPIYIRVNKNQRARVVKRRVDNVYRQITFMDEKGMNRTIRLKLNSNTIYQDEQIKQGILANERFTAAEVKASEFTNGVATTSNPIVMAFYDAHPQNEAFKGVCHEIKTKMFKHYDAEVDVRNKNTELRKRVMAAAKIMELELGDAQQLMIRLNGSHFEPPKDLEACQNKLMDWLDDTDEEGMDSLMRDEMTPDEEARIIIGKAIHAKVLSFDEMQGHVAKKRGTQWASLKQISKDIAPAERLSMFVEFVTSKDGAAVFADLKKDFGVIKKESKKPKEAVA